MFPTTFNRTPYCDSSWLERKSSQKDSGEERAHSLVTAEFLNLRSCEVHQSMDFFWRSLEVFDRECICAYALDAEPETYFKHLGMGTSFGDNEMPSNTESRTLLSAKNPSR